MRTLFDATTDQLRQFVPGLVANFTIRAALSGLLDETAQTLLPRFLGQTVATQISNVTGADIATLKQAYRLAQTVVAKLGFAEYLPFAEVQIGDDGITVTSSENRRAAFDYQTKKLDQQLRESGWQKLDELVDLVAANPDSFPGWSSSTYYQQHQDAIFKSATEFSLSYPIQDRWLTFWALRPFIQGVEDNLGQVYLARVAALPGTVTDTQKKPLLRNLRRALAYEAVIVALPNLSVELNGLNVQINYASQYGGKATYYTPPGKDLLEWVKQNLQNQAAVFWQAVEAGLLNLNPPTDPADDGMGLVLTDGPFQMI